MRERSLRDRVCRDALRHYGVDSLQLALHADAGWPDRLFLTLRAPTWLEFKRRGETPRPLQEYRMETLRKLGYAVAWTDNYEDAMDLIRRGVR